MEFTNKTILVLSQQDWGTMFVSKHHYALELSKLGNTVYYVNGPHRQNELKKGEIVIEKTEHENLFLIKHRLPFAYMIKFKAKALYNLLVKRHVKAIEKTVPGKIDLVWSFDLTNTLPLSAFSKSIKKIYMLADMPTTDSITSAKTADLILSTNFSDDFLKDFFKQYDVPKKFTNHGVSELFLEEQKVEKKYNGIQVGLSGSFVTRFIDWDTLLLIIRQHPDVTFNFWGVTNINEGNLGYEEGEHLQSLKELYTLDNVKLHGPVSKAELVKGFTQVDAFLICYDVFKEQSNGTNYHKMLEYLSTGKVVVSNNVLAYVGTDGLVEMPVERQNDKLPELFSSVIKNLEEYNSPDKQKVRRAYAENHTYRRNIMKILEMLYK